jgi:hypothetical protein
MVKVTSGRFVCNVLRYTERYVTLIL